MRSIIQFFAHAQVVAFNHLQMTLGEEPKSTALGVEACYGRVWDKRRCTAWRSSPTRGYEAEPHFKNTFAG